MKIAVLLGVAASLMWSMSVSAQGSTNPCGTMIEPEEMLDTYAKLFYDAAAARWRAAHSVVEQHPAVERTVVADTAVCSRVMEAVVQQLSQRPDWNALREAGYEIAIYKIGPYIAVHERDLWPESEQSLIWLANLLVFTADDLRYLGTMSYRL